MYFCLQLTYPFRAKIADVGILETPTPLASANVGNGDTPPPLKHADVLNGWSQTQKLKSVLNGGQNRILFFVHVNMNISCIILILVAN